MRGAAIAGLILAACAPARPAQDAAPADVHYELSMPQPTTHLFHITMHVRSLPEGHVDFVMPVWTPGSYKVRDYCQFVQDVDAGGLPVEKIDKTTWRVTHRGASEVRLTYRVFAHDMTVRTSWLDSEMATANGASLFFYVPELKDHRCTLQVTPPPGWRLATGLKRIAENRFEAADYDVFVDSPILMGDLQESSFTVRGTALRLAVAGPCPLSMERLRDDFRKIVETTVALFDDVPYEHYTFLIRSLPGGGGGGLEHLNSTLIDVATARLGTEEGYRRFLHLAAHEFFHTWLVKRIRPRELGPFDYTKENTTRLLWLMEGVTSYYDILIPSRAGLIEGRDALDAFARTLSDLAATPGRKRESPEMASFNAWIHHYQPGPHSVNSTASYYATGRIRGLALDLEIRRRGSRSLDDVLRHLYREPFKKHGKGVTPEEVQKACEDAAGTSLEDFFARCIRGTEDPQLSAGLEHVGLSQRDEGIAKPYLGARFEDHRIVTSVLEGGPAWRDGLCVGDELLAVDGLRADARNWGDLVANRKDGEKIRLTVFRRGMLKDVLVTLERRSESAIKLAKIDAPSEAQERAFERWLLGKESP
ncbi:MAG: M61 family metallopeptidase [Planctomycetes bacterium]|nr:M61 family metallopeptidase [Planctomycetota bacterium]